MTSALFRQQPDIRLYDLDRPLRTPSGTVPRYALDGLGTMRRKAAPQIDDPYPMLFDASGRPLTRYALQGLRGTEFQAAVAAVRRLKTDPARMRALAAARRADPSARAGVATMVVKATVRREAAKASGMSGLGVTFTNTTISVAQSDMEALLTQSDLAKETQLLQAFAVGGTVDGYLLNNGTILYNRLRAATDATEKALIEQATQAYLAGASADAAAIQDRMLSDNASWTEMHVRNACGFLIRTPAEQRHLAMRDAALVQLGQMTQAEASANAEKAAQTAQFVTSGAAESLAQTWEPAKEFVTALPGALADSARDLLNKAGAAVTDLSGVLAWVVANLKWIVIGGVAVVVLPPVVRAVRGLRPTRA